MNNEQERQAIYRTAIAWLERSTLGTKLKASAIALVPTIPTKLEGMAYCQACESVLCGACGQCHSLDLAPPDLCPAVKIQWAPIARPGGKPITRSSLSHANRKRGSYA